MLEGVAGAGMQDAEVREVVDRAGARAFEEAPYSLYRPDPNWVAPLRSTERRRWDSRRNPSLRLRRVRRFVAYRGRSIVGRVAAIHDPIFAARWEPHTGLFGFFECQPHLPTARTLLRAAGEALRGYGLGRAVGPVNLSTHDEVGLLVDGFGRPPCLLTPYNPPYYSELLGECGYVPLRDLHAYRWTPDRSRSRAVNRLLGPALTAQGSHAFSVRALGPADWDADLRTLFLLYNDCFEHVWGFVPLTWDEFRQRAGDFRAFYRPELAVIAYRDAQPVGFSLVLPDVNAALGACGGRLLPFGWLRLWFALPRLKTGRFILMGVRPGFRGRGVAAVLVGHIERAVRALGFTEVEVSLILASNEAMKHVVRAFGCERSRTYRLFAKDLTTSPTASDIEVPSDQSEGNPVRQ